MINIDSYIVEFVSNNWITLSLALGLLKIVAKMTPWVVDDALHTLLAGILGLIKKPAAGMPLRGDRGETPEDSIYEKPPGV